MDALSAGVRLRRIAALAAREARRALGVDRTVYVDQRTAEYGDYWRAAAERLGARWTTLSPGVWEARLGAARVRFCGHVAPADDAVALRVAGDKPLCLRLAAEAGAPVPEHHLFTLRALPEVRARVAADPGPWVVKPARGSASGIGVTTAIATPGALTRAAVRASLHGEEILLERMVPGESCRLLFLDGELLHAVRRRGVRLDGDGRATVRELARASGCEALLAAPEAAATLAAQGMAAGAVPPRGASVLLRGVPDVPGARRDLRTIYDEPITEQVSPALRDTLAAAVRAIGSRFAGVDVVTVDPSRPLQETGGAFLELNTTPGIHHHYHTARDRAEHPVAVRVLSTLLDADGRVGAPFQHRKDGPHDARDRFAAVGAPSHR